MYNADYFESFREQQCTAKWTVQVAGGIGLDWPERFARWTDMERAVARVRGLVGYDWAGHFTALEWHRSRVEGCWHQTMCVWTWWCTAACLCGRQMKPGCNWWTANGFSEASVKLDQYWWKRCNYLSCHSRTSTEGSLGL